MERTPSGVARLWLEENCFPQSAEVEQIGPRQQLYPMMDDPLPELANRRRGREQISLGGLTSA